MVEMLWISITWMMYSYFVEILMPEYLLRIFWWSSNLLDREGQVPVFESSVSHVISIAPTSSGIS